MIETPSSDPLVFGIGCFSFEAPSADLLTMENPAGTYSVHNWAADVERYLAAFPSIDQIRVEGFHSVRGDSPTTWRDETAAAIKGLEPDGRHRGGDLRPHPTDGSVSFVITIPTRTQADVMFAAEGRSGTRFDVDIYFSWGMPVAFVRTYADFDDPAVAVAIVREFVKREEPLRVQDDNPIRFICMGPSPIWSQYVILRAPDDQEVDFVSERLDSPGYSWHTYNVRISESIPDRATAYRLLQSRLVSAASAVYDFFSQGLVLGLSQSFIEEVLADLVESNRARGFRAWFKRLRGGGQQANDLMLEILATQLAHQRTSAANEKAWAEIADPLGRETFEEHAKRSLEDSSVDHVDNAREVVALLNSRYSRDIEIVSVLLASLLGGVVGALATILAGTLAGN